MEGGGVKVFEPIRSLEPWFRWTLGQALGSRTRGHRGLSILLFIPLITTVAAQRNRTHTSTKLGRVYFAELPIQLKRGSTRRYTLLMKIFVLGHTLRLLLNAVMRQSLSISSCGTQPRFKSQATTKDGTLHKRSFRVGETTRLTRRSTMRIPYPTTAGIKRKSVHYSSTSPGQPKP